MYTKVRPNTYVRPNNEPFVWYLEEPNGSVFWRTICQKNGRGSSISVIKVLQWDPAQQPWDPAAAGMYHIGVLWWQILTNLCHFFWQTSAILTEVHQVKQRLVNSPKISQFWTYVFWRRYLQIICTDNLPNLIFVIYLTYGFFSFTAKGFLIG